MIHRQIEDKLRSLGLTAVYQGYFCLIHAALLAEENPERLTLLSKWLYPDVAKECGISIGRVDSSLRAAIRRCCRCSGTEVARMCGVDGEPTVAWFIQGLVASVQEGSER